MSVLFPPPRLIDAHRWRAMRIGLLGGSFNPPHSGHVHVSRTAMRMLGLDCVWWLVSPQNPFKSTRDTASHDKRMALCQPLLQDEPRIVASDLEQIYGTVRTVDTLEKLIPAFSGTAFVWITGQDNVFEFHRWRRWKDILGMVATAHVARPPALSTIRNAPLKMLANHKHRHLARPGRYPLIPGTSYWLQGTRLDSASSTAVRKG